MSRHREKDVCIVGLGQTPLYRKPHTYPFVLALDACEAAVADAGLTLADIDGVATFPLGQPGVGEGIAAAHTADVSASLDLKLTWHGASDNAAQFSSVLAAVAAVSAGYCKHALVWRSWGERWVPSYGSAFKGPRKSLPPTFGRKAWLEPFWAPSASNWVGVHASAHMHRYGITREQMSAIAIVQRQNAARNPKAIYRDAITLDDYMCARMISSPFGLYDCDVPCDGAIAVVITSAERARDLPQKPVHFEAVGGGSQDRMESWVSRRDFPHMVLNDAAKMMWSRTDLKPKDVDTAHLYDGFTYLAMFWLEALGFCKEGESGAFIEGGHRISPDGELPLNSNGGQLSEGRTHGHGHLCEAVLQLRGQAGDRQIKDAKVAVAGVGGGYLGGALLLRAD